ncbi:MAG: DUF4199 domain-containing protein [Bacteroidales bacterium]|nr:DUF4199 domain-containing protein [Bacteroidales bacterium]
MEQKKTSVFNHSLTYGAIIGIIMIIWTVLMFVLDLSLNRALGYVSYLILIVGMFMGMKSYRDKVQGGTINYGKAFGIGVLICVIAFVISGIYSIIHVKFVDTTLIQRMMEMTEEKLLSRGISEEQIDMQMQMSAKFMKPVIMFLSATIFSVIIGSIISLILAAFVKKDENPMTDAV